MLLTENYSFNKPEANENVNIDLLNENMDNIDRNLNHMADTIDTVAVSLSTHTEESQTELQHLKTTLNNFEKNALFKNDEESASYILDLAGKNTGGSTVTDSHIIETVKDDIDSEGTIWHSIQARVESMVSSDKNNIYYIDEEPSDCENGDLWLTNAV